jgi:hypothetical protein
LILARTLFCPRVVSDDGGASHRVIGAREIWELGSVPDESAPHGAILSGLGRFEKA